MTSSRNRIGFLFVLAIFGSVACKKDVVQHGGGIQLSLDKISPIENAVIQQEYYTDAVFTSETTGYAVSNTGVIVKTTDGGRNWVTLNSNVNFFIREIVFTDPQTGYAVGGDALGSWILKTGNAGASWSAVKLNTAGGRPTGVWFINNNNGFITGPGFFLRTSNGGTSWTNVLPAVTTGNFYDVRFSTAAVGYATTEDGAYYRTSDAGQNWQRVETGVEDNLEDILVAGSDVYFRSGTKLINAQAGKPTITLPDAVHQLEFIDEHSAIGIGQHYEGGFWPYGDIFITNNKWSSSSSRKYAPEHALAISAMARISDRKFLMLGTGHLIVSVVKFEY